MSATSEPLTLAAWAVHGFHLDSVLAESLWALHSGPDRLGHQGGGETFFSLDGSGAWLGGITCSNCVSDLWPFRGAGTNWGDGSGWAGNG